MRLLLITLLIAGCATPYAQYQNDAQFQKDRLHCEMESLKVSGGTSMEAALDRGVYRGMCMKAKCYTR